MIDNARRPRLRIQVPMCLMQHGIEPQVWQNRVHGITDHETRDLGDHEKRDAK